MNRIKPYFKGKDARDLEDLLEGVYVYQSNYKLQNLALWVPLATVEFAILDMLGHISGKSIGELIGTIHNREIAVYQANGDRGISAEKTIEQMLKEVEESKAKAVKFKVGGRMSNNYESPAGRTEKLIPLVRKTFGDKMVCYADSNGSYTADEAIRIGKLLEEYKMDFYDAFLDYSNKLVKKGKKLVICGDVNTAHKEIDLARPKENSKTSGFLQIEREWMDKFFSHNYHDTFRMFNDEPENYSWWDQVTRARDRNVGWRIDYFFVSDNFKKNVKDAFIMPDVMGSDHCPVGIDIQI